MNKNYDEDEISAAIGEFREEVNSKYVPDIN